MGVEQRIKFVGQEEELRIDPVNIECLVAVAGPTLSGKTEFAWRIAVKMGEVPYFENDDIRREIHVYVEQYQPVHSEEARKLMLERTAEQFRLGKRSAVLVSTFSTQESREEIRRLAEEFGKKVIWIEMYCDQTSLESRYEARIQAGADTWDGKFVPRQYMPFPEGWSHIFIDNSTDATVGLSEIDEMVRRLFKITSVEDLPFDPRSLRKIVGDIIDRALSHPVKHTNRFVAEGRPVKEWLPEEMGTMDMRTGFYDKYVRGVDPALDIIFDSVVKHFHGEEVLAQMLIMFRPALKNAPRDGWRGGCPVILQVFRRSEVVMVVVSGNVSAALETAPGAAKTLLDVEKEIAHVDFMAMLKQMEAEGVDFDRVVRLAHRRVARVDMAE